MNIMADRFRYDKSFSIHARRISNKHRALNIPVGRVSQRISAIQNNADNPVENRPFPRQTSTSPLRDQPLPVAHHLKQPKSEPEPRDASTILEDNLEASVGQLEHQTLEPVPTLSTATYSPKGKDPVRGRSSNRDSVNEPFESAQEENLDEVLDAVRERLYSVQKMVRREQSGSSQARDEMMDELGTMLDHAIATTMTPIQSPRPPTRGSSIRRSSPVKQSAMHSQLERSQSVKLTKIQPTESVHILPRPRRATTTSEAGSNPNIRARTVTDQYTSSEPDRNLQIPNPNSFGHRRTGFPLVSPVRERALL